MLTKKVSETIITTHIGALTLDSVNCNKIQLGTYIHASFKNKSTDILCTIQKAYDTKQYTAVFPAQHYT